MLFVIDFHTNATKHTRNQNCKQELENKLLCLVALRQYFTMVNAMSPSLGIQRLVNRMLFSIWFSGLLIHSAQKNEEVAPTTTWENVFIWDIREMAGMSYPPAKTINWSLLHHKFRLVTTISTVCSCPSSACASTEADMAMARVVLTLTLVSGRVDMCRCRSLWIMGCKISRTYWTCLGWNCLWHLAARPACAICSFSLTPAKPSNSGPSKRQLGGIEI